MSAVSISKSELRKIYLKKRKSLTKNEIEDYSQKIITRFLSRFKIAEKQKVHLFLPIEKFNEINTTMLIDFFWKNKVEVFVPKVMGDDMISVKLMPHTALTQSTWGIMEPEIHEGDEAAKNFDFIITPLLYCDHQGNRIGYGKGFYDRFFLSVNSNVIKIGLNYFSPNEAISDVSQDDIPLDYLVTPEAVFSFSLKSKSTK